MTSAGNCRYTFLLLAQQPKKKKPPRTSTHKPDGMATFMNLENVKIEKRKTGRQAGSHSNGPSVGSFFWERFEAGDAGATCSPMEWNPLKGTVS